MVFERGDCYEKDGAWCIICESDAENTTWRLGTVPEKRFTVGTSALAFHLDLQGWRKLPIKVSPDFKPSTHCVIHAN